MDNPRPPRRHKPHALTARHHDGPPRDTRTEASTPRPQGSYSQTRNTAHRHEKRLAPRDERINPPTHKSRTALIDDDNGGDTDKTDDNANGIPTRRHDKQATPRHRHDELPREEHHETPGRDDPYETRRRDDEAPRDDTTRRKGANAHERDDIRDARARRSTRRSLARSIGKRRDKNTPTEARTRGELTQSKLN